MKPGSVVHCTKCGSRDVSPSRLRRAVWDAVMRVFGKTPYRCHACRGRFYGSEEEEEVEDSDSG